MAIYTWENKQIISSSTLTMAKIYNRAQRKINKDKIMRLLILIDSLQKVTRSRYNVNFMSYLGGIDLLSDICAKFEILYQDTGFME